MRIGQQMIDLTKMIWSAPGCHSQTAIRLEKTLNRIMKCHRQLEQGELISGFVEIAQRCTVTGTKLISCLNKEIQRTLKEVNIWKVKFDNDFPECAYHPWWTAYENYKLQHEYQGKLCLWKNEDYVDDILYRYSWTNRHLNNLYAYYFCDRYRAYQQVQLDLTKPGLFAILEDLERGGLSYFCSVNTIEEVKNTIRDGYLFISEGKYQCEYVVVRLDRMTLEFSLDDEQFDKQEDPETWFKFFNSYEDLTALDNAIDGFL